MVPEILGKLIKFDDYSLNAVYFEISAGTLYPPPHHPRLNRVNYECRVARYARMEASSVKK